MRRMRAPVSVHSMRPERTDAAENGLGANGSEGETRRSRRDWMGPREKQEVEDDIRVEEVEESEQHDNNNSNNNIMDEDDEDALDIPATHAPRRVERASRRSAASTPRPSTENDSDAANEPESESMEDIDGNMVIYVSSRLCAIAGT